MRSIMSNHSDAHRRARSRILTCALLLYGLAPGLSHASAAGGSTIACEATAQLLYVIDTNANGIREPGETDPCTNPVVDDTDPLVPVVTNGVAGPVCLPATVAQLRGTLTLIADDDARDNNVGGSQNTGQVFTMILDVRHGDTLFRIADSYTASSLDALFLGNWNQRITSEERLYGIAFKGSMFLTPDMQSGSVVTDGAFEDIGNRLSQIAEDEGLVVDASAVMPIVVHATRDATRKRFSITDPSGCGDVGPPVADGCGELEVDEEASSLASIAVYRLTIHFAEKLTGPPPACS
jgi:hypothetical protein